ncbi:MAG: prepilin-type N-terminal cleavage/methylation domain-containing protein [Burkholderiales bacterium]|nr:prepilin-type N-terminal cleavage/methylation domain-containing protein [Burkholderiales bacterium]
MMRPYARRARRLGFSMLELVIALAMLAVMVGYGMPAYVAYAARGHRLEAVVALHRAAQYIVVRMADRDIDSEPSLPAGLDRAPEHGRIVYRIEWVQGADSRTGYEIWAKPVDGGPMHGDACGTFVLDGFGMRSNRDARGVGLDAQACWAGRGA